MRLLIAALAILAATSAQAQEVPIVSAGAGGRFERQIDAKTRSDGFGPAQVAAFRGAIAPIIEQLAAMPAVNAPPAHRYHGEDDAKLASRTQMWKAIDRAALAARVR